MPGTLLGPFDQVDISPIEVTLSAGDVVVFHTDGATDVPPPHNLDETGWANLVNEAVAPGGTADEIAHRIQQALEALLPFESRNDDIALLVLAVPADNHPTRHLISKREDFRQLDAAPSTYPTMTTPRTW